MSCSIRCDKLKPRRFGRVMTAAASSPFAASRLVRQQRKQRPAVTSLPLALVVFVATASTLCLHVSAECKTMGSFDLRTKGAAASECSADRARADAATACMEKQAALYASYSVVRPCTSCPGMSGRPYIIDNVFGPIVSKDSSGKDSCRLLATYSCCFDVERRGAGGGAPAASTPAQQPQQQPSPTLSPPPSPQPQQQQQTPQQVQRQQQVQQQPQQQQQPVAPTQQPQQLRGQPKPPLSGTYTIDERCTGMPGKIDGFAEYDYSGSNGDDGGGKATVRFNIKYDMFIVHCAWDSTTECRPATDAEEAACLRGEGTIGGAKFDKCAPGEPVWHCDKVKFTAFTEDCGGTKLQRYSRTCICGELGGPMRSAYGAGGGPNEKCLLQATHT